MKKSDKKTKVLLIAYACEPNKGSEPGVGWSWTLHLSKYVDVTVLTRSNNRIDIQKEIVKNPFPNLSFVYFDLPEYFIKLKKITGVWLYYFLWQVGIFFFYKNKLKQENFDLVHHVTFMSNKINIVPFLGKKNIVGPVGGLEILPKGFLIFTGHPVKEYLRNLLIKRYKYSPFYNLFIGRIDKLILTSRSSVHLINQKFHPKVAIMQIGAIDVIPPQNTDKAEGKVQLYWGGILERWKGLELLLLSLKNLKYDFHLSITGKGSDEDYFKEIVNNNSLESKVSFYGWVSASKLDEIKNMCNIFIFTSLRETTGSILLEMMGRGKACIVIDHGGPSEICNNENSIKIELKDVNHVVLDLSKAIEKLINNPKERMNIGLKAYEEIRNNYLWDNKAKQMVEIYKEVLYENSPSP